MSHYDAHAAHCPFCGEPPRVDRVHFDGHWQRVRCGNCGAMGPAEKNALDAWSAWDQREHPSDKAQ